MDDNTRAKIDRMTRLTRPFLWDLCPGYRFDGRMVGEPMKKGAKVDDSMEYNTKEATYMWLTKNDFTVDKKDTYEIWVNKISNPADIEQVFKRLIIPQLKRKIGADTMEELRRWWMDCRIPDRRFVVEHERNYKVDLKKDASSVLEIHFRFGYVHRFGPLAPIIFEDAAEWLEDEGLLKKR